MNHHNGDAGGKACQVIRFLHSLVAGSQHIDILSFKKLRVTGGAVGYASACEFFLAFYVQLPWPGSQVQNHAAGLKIPAALCLHHKYIILFADSRHRGPLPVHRGKGGPMLPEPFHKVLAAV